jgi:hypothetical protein
VKKPQSASASAHIAFVNALRECLVLEPLYDRTKGRRHVERFGGQAHIYVWARRGVTESGMVTRKGSGA